MSISERIKEYLFFSKKNTTELAKEINVSQSALNNVVRGASLPGAKILLPLAEQGISIDWLLTGRGEMLKEQVTTTVNKGDIRTSDSYIKEIKYLKKTIERLEDQIKDKQQIINLLMNKPS